MDKFYPQLEKRQDQGNPPYHQDFEKEKIVWITLAENGRFSYDDGGIYCEATAFMMTENSIKYLYALLNSKLTCWFLRQNSPQLDTEALRWKKVYVETIPIPKIPAAEQLPFIRLVDCILQAKAANPEADVNDWEKELDHLVYSPYCLTESEISAIEGGK